MGWRFRQSFTVVPGLRLNLSRSGLSASIGGAPFTLNLGPRGLTGTASIPGTGLSYRHRFSNHASNDQPSMFVPKAHLPVNSVPAEWRYTNTAPVQEIHSASTELLTSETLKELKGLIQSAYHQHQEISNELDSARSQKIELQEKFDSWEHGFLLKKIFKKAFAERKEAYDTEKEHVEELEQQLNLSTISTEIEIENEQAEFYYRLRDEFAALCECAAIWDVKTRQATDKFHERTTADQKLSRECVQFRLDKCDLIAWEQNVPHLKNAKGGDIYLYPGFIIYRAAREAFSLIEYQDINVTASNVNFQEENGVPSDSKIIGRTWAKANKDGSRDRRFVNNYEIPIALYGSVTLRSDHGLWEEFHFSNFDKMASFIKAFGAFTASFEGVSHA
ncbi:MAG TPA: DUF4236 domain-containing protein [Terracidiphilus sp.]|nr:DUF4236 domain-containing protein [Terracidiphilus sp.]